MDCAVELYSMTKSFSMAGWRVAFLLGNAEVVGALTKLKCYLDYGTFQPIQIAATVTMNEAADYPAEVNAVYESRRNAMVDGLARIGWDVERPRGTMFVWAPIPEAYARDGLDRVRHPDRQRLRRRRLAGRRLRAGRRRVRAVRADRERAAHRAGRPPTSSAASPSSAEAVARAAGGETGWRARP